MDVNGRLADIFDEMAREFRKDRYRKRAYENAANAIRRHDKPITSGKQAQKEIKGIGKSIGTKIDEIIETGQLGYLEARPQSQKDKAEVVKQFEKIYGVGPVTAEKWYDAGYHTFESLAQLYPQMNDAQKLGYYYYEQLNQRIPRAEMDQFSQVFHNVWDPLNVDYVIAGSYRRGEPSSGDIDILVKETPGVDMNSLLRGIKDYLVGSLAIGPTKYMGIIRLSPQNLARRIDIRVVKPDQWAYALLYFTGSKQLNVDMRTKALALGLTMNEYEMVGPHGKKYPAETEREVFNYLGMPYLEPTQRSVIMKPGVQAIAQPPPQPQVSPQPIQPQPQVPTKGKWHRPTQSVLLYVSDAIINTGNIAGFDLDWTLVRPYQAVWPKSTDDIELLPNRISKLKELREGGYTIVIFTNQKSTTTKKLDFNFGRINYFINNLIPDIPIILFMSIADDQYRKPNIGMYQLLQKMVPSINTSFYCGDAAGRPQDFSDSDKMFAQNIGMVFYTPEQIFLPVERLKPLPQLGLSDIDFSNMNRTMVLFVGMPGSGKTTYYQKKLAPLGYVHVNQDILGTKAKVLKLARETMVRGSNVCIDATNPGQNRRQEFYDLATRNNYNIVVIHFVRDGRGWNKLRANPVPTIAYNMYYKYLIEPTPTNTPGSLYQIF